MFIMYSVYCVGIGIFIKRLLLYQYYTLFKLRNVVGGDQFSLYRSPVISFYSPPSKLSVCLPCSIATLLRTSR